MKKEEREEKERQLVQTAEVQRPPALEEKKKAHGTCSVRASMAQSGKKKARQTRSRQSSARLNRKRWWGSRRGVHGSLLPARRRRRRAGSMGVGGRGGRAASWLAPPRAETGPADAQHPPKPVGEKQSSTQVIQRPELARRPGPPARWSAVPGAV